MPKKKLPATIEECNTEMERTQTEIRQYKNRNKMLDRKIAVEKRKERSHRLCSRGGYLESIVPELIGMTDEEARTFLYTAACYVPRLAACAAQGNLLFSCDSLRCLPFCVPHESEYLAAASYSLSWSFVDRIGR